MCAGSEPGTAFPTARPTAPCTTPGSLILKLPIWPSRHVTTEPTGSGPSEMAQEAAPGPTVARVAETPTPHRGGHPGRSWPPHRRPLIIGWSSRSQSRRLPSSSRPPFLSRIAARGSGVGHVHTMWCAGRPGRENANAFPSWTVHDIPESRFRPEASEESAFRNCLWPVPAWHTLFGNSHGSGRKATQTKPDARSDSHERFPLSDAPDRPDRRARGHRNLTRSDSIPRPLRECRRTAPHERPHSLDDDRRLPGIVSPARRTPLPVISADISQMTDETERWPSPDGYESRTSAPWHASRPDSHRLGSVRRLPGVLCQAPLCERSLL
jgi:hypothetical protein